MKRRYKLIIAIGVVCSIGIVAYFGYAAVRLMYELNRLEARRSLILYESDHQALLEACRELSRKVDVGQLKPGCYSLYGTPDPETKQFPQPILDLEPLQVIIEKNGQVNIFMWPSVMYGLIFFPDEDEDSLAEEPKDNYEGWRIEVVVWQVRFISGDEFKAGALAPTVCRNNRRAKSPEHSDFN